MRNFVSFSILLVLALSFSSCRKDEKLPPTGSFVEPSPGQVFSSVDTLLYVVEYSHHQPVVELYVRLKNLNGTPILGSIVVNPNKNTGSVSGGLILSEVFLPSANYYLELVISDGALSSSVLRQIRIDQVPKIRESVWVTYLINPNQYATEILDSSAYVFNTAGKHLFSFIDSKHGMLYSCGLNQGDLKAFDIRNNILKWSINNPGMGVTGYFRAGFVDKGLIYVSREDGQITAYDFNKAVRFNAVLNQGSYLEQFIIANSLVVGEKKSIPPNQTFISVFNTNGTGRHEAFLGNGLEIVSLQKGQGDDIWVFANFGTGRIGRYNMAANFINWLYTMPVGIILNAEKKTDSKFWVSTNNEGLQEYATTTNSLIPFHSGIVPHFIKYDEVKDELFVLDSNRVRVLNPMTGAEIRQSIISGKALSVNFLYNRD